jgi:hypothetical protein
MVFLLLKNCSAQEEAPLHLRTARKFISSSKDLPPLNCYQFVNQVLQDDLEAPSLKQRDQLWRQVLQDLPETHHSEEIVPYHYFLMALAFKQAISSLCSWATVNIFEVKPGDILVYLGVDYEPNLAKRVAGRLTSSHIAFIDDVLSNDHENAVRLRLIDCSARKAGRLLDLDDPSSVPSTSGQVAYSFLNLKRTSEDLKDPFGNCQTHFLWEACFDRQCPKTLRVAVLRILRS